MKLNYHRQMVRKVLKKKKIGQKCIDCAVEGNEGQDDVLNQPRTDFHFDGCDFNGGIKYICEQWSEIDRLIADDCEENICAIFKAWGRISHAVQDFYAHSNWVELGNKKIWNVESIPEDLISGVWVLSKFVCRIENKTCPTHAVLVHDENDISKDEPGRPNFGKALRLAYKHTKELAEDLKDKLGKDCLKACR